MSGRGSGTGENAQPDPDPVGLFPSENQNGLGGEGGLPSLTSPHIAEFAADAETSGTIGAGLASAGLVAAKGKLVLALLILLVGAGAYLISGGDDDPTEGATGQPEPSPGELIDGLVSQGSDRAGSGSDEALSDAIMSGPDAVPSAESMDKVEGSPPDSVTAGALSLSWERGGVLKGGAAYSLDATERGLVAGGISDGGFPAVWVSIDGATWALTEIDTDRGFVNDVGHLGDTVIAVGFTDTDHRARIWVSERSGSWRVALTGADTGFYDLVASIAAGPRGLLAVGPYGSDNAVWSSSDGLDWVQETAPGGGGRPLGSVVWTGSTWLAVGGATDVIALASPDGVAWDDITGNLEDLGVGGLPTAFIFPNGLPGVTGIGGSWNAVWALNDGRWGQAFLSPAAPQGTGDTVHGAMLFRDSLLLLGQRSTADSSSGGCWECATVWLPATDRNGWAAEQEFSPETGLISDEGSVVWAGGTHGDVVVVLGEDDRESLVWIGTPTE